VIQISRFQATEFPQLLLVSKVRTVCHCNLSVLQDTVNCLVGGEESSPRRQCPFSQRDCRLGKKVIKHGVAFALRNVSNFCG